MAKTMVIGCGNPLRGDDGVGRAVIQALGGVSLPEEVRLVEAGTPGLALLDILRQADRIIIVDAVAGEGRPGTVFRLRAEDLEKPPPGSCSLHDLGIAEVLALGRLAEPEALPGELVFVGIQAACLEPGREGLSQEVAAAVPRAVQAVLEEIGIV
ncbi:MAG: hydrogenase maturation protease [Firmicutes bacterium]|nr:hydrogenase maturation protease [Bacillota bacterium]MCL5038800.1 hydrogenase maturation protease [Bacillota bacterium]